MELLQLEMGEEQRFQTRVYISCQGGFPGIKGTPSSQDTSLHAPQHWGFVMCLCLLPVTLQNLIKKLLFFVKFKCCALRACIALSLFTGIYRTVLQWPVLAYHGHSWQLSWFQLVLLVKETAMLVEEHVPLYCNLQGSDCCKLVLGFNINQSILYLNRQVLIFSGDLAKGHMYQLGFL